MPTGLNKIPWEGSTRRARLPANWEELKAEGDRLNPRRICHVCGKPGGDDFDHKNRGDDHRQENLDWIHRDPCHKQKTQREALAGRLRLHRPPEEHPAFR